MSFGKMNVFVELRATTIIKDPEGFTRTEDITVASVRAYREDRHGNVQWANRAAFSQASTLFRLRAIPGLVVDTALVLLCGGARYRILNVEDVRGRGMYLELLTEKIEPTKQ